MDTIPLVSISNPQTIPPGPDRRLCVAPMMDCTDRHQRYFLRLITRRTLLYTEMVAAGAILYGDRAGFLDHQELERPLALQVGGNEPAELARCARYAQQWGFDEINLNVGCPSSRVRAGRFGACLMAQPDRVAACVAAMAGATKLPVTVKTRIGIDDLDSFDYLLEFVDTVSRAGCQTWIIHARKAWLKGLSPKQNRTIPALDYQRVYRLKRERPDLVIVINGGITDLDQTMDQLALVDGVMMGRQAYHHPYLLAQADSRVFGDRRPPSSQEAVLNAYLDYVDQQLSQGVVLHHMTRHIMGLFQGQAGARSWRRHLGQQAVRAGAGREVVEQAHSYIGSRDNGHAAAQGCRALSRSTAAG